MICTTDVRRDRHKWMTKTHICFPIMDSTEKEITDFLGVGQVVWACGRSVGGILAKEGGQGVVMGGVAARGGESPSGSRVGVGGTVVPEGEVFRAWEGVKSGFRRR